MFLWHWNYFWCSSELLHTSRWGGGGGGGRNGMGKKVVIILASKEQGTWWIALCQFRPIPPLSLPLLISSFHLSFNSTLLNQLRNLRRDRKAATVELRPVLPHSYVGPHAELRAPVGSFPLDRWLVGIWHLIDLPPAKMAKGICTTGPNIYVLDEWLNCPGTKCSINKRPIMHNHFVDVWKCMSGTTTSSVCLGEGAEMDMCSPELISPIPTPMRMERKLAPTCEWRWCGDE